ncbi:MAG: LamG-like jellyroll fold domain-containing protein, partial [Bacteroidota bacterium]
VLFNKLEFLDTAGEWYYDKNSGTLYLWTSNGNSPDNHLIRASVNDNAVIAEGKNHISIEDLELLHSNSDGVYLNGCDYITVKNNAFILPDARAIAAESSSSDNHVISNNYVNGANHEGICLKGSSHSITDNVIENINLFENIGVSGVGKPMGGRGIYVSYGTQNVIKHNKLQNIGYNGIQMFEAPYTTIENNVVKNACLIKEDGGGIYCFNTSETNPGCEYSVVRGNIIDNVPGTGEGYPGSLRQGCGIYMDDRIHHIKIENNTVSNVSCYGIYLHNNKYIDVVNNTIFDTGSAYRATGSYNATANSIKNNTIVNLASSNYSGISAVLGMLSSKETSIVDIDYNVYVDHHREKPLRDMSDYTYKTFSDWKTTTGKDANSKYKNSSLADGEYEKLFYNDTKQSKSFSLGSYVYKDLDENEISGSITLEPFTSKVLIKTNTETTVENQYPSIQDQTFEISGDIQPDDFVGQVIASDPDAGQTLNYVITSGNEEGLFYMNSSTGEIFAKTNAQITENKSVGLVVEVTDDATNPLSSAANITINITAMEATPTVDTTAPVVSSFAVPSTSSSLTVTVSSFQATDDQSLAGYLLTETADTPQADNSNWTSSAPAEYVFATEGTKTLYAWAKDAAGNISNPLSDDVVITLTDMTSTFSEYLFEETSGTTVFDSQCSNDGTLMNEELRTTGAKGQGVEFTGLGYANMGNCYGANVEKEVSLSAWIKPDATSSGYQGIIMHGGPNIDTYALYIENNYKRVAFKTTGTTSAWSYADNITTLWDGNWHHLAVTYNGAEKIIYLDGDIIMQVDAAGPIESGEGYSLLVGAGRDENPASLLYQGLIDEVRVYNYALTDSAVKELYNSVATATDAVYTEEEIYICDGEEYMGWTESGQYERTLTSSTGGDSIVTTNLYVNPVYFITEDITIKEGESYEGWTESGQYQRVLTTVDGCDSTVTTNLTVLLAIYTTENISICDGESYEGWTETGQYERTLEASAGADSTITTNLTVYPTYNITEDVTINEGESYEGWTESGQYQRALTTVNGCDSTVTTNLTVVSPSFYSEYLFEEDAGSAVYDSKGTVDGTIYNEEIRISGVNGNGLEFTGSGYVNLGQNYGRFQTEVTLSAWLKPDASARGGYQGIIMHGGPNIDTYALYLWPNKRRVAFKTTGTTEEWIYIDDVNTLWDGNWHLITATYNGAEKVIYLDDTVLFRVAASGKIESGEGYNLYIAAGRDDNKPKLLYKGQIDEVRIYNSALTGPEVETLYIGTQGSNIKVGQISTSADFNEMESGNSFNFYPNPATSHITLDYDHQPEVNTMIQITDASGNIVFNQPVETLSGRIDISHLRSGMYFIRSVNSETQIVKKLIKR